MEIDTITVNDNPHNFYSRFVTFIDTFSSAVIKYAKNVIITQHLIQLLIVYSTISNNQRDANVGALENLKHKLDVSKSHKEETNANPLINISKYIHLWSESILYLSSYLKEHENKVNEFIKQFESLEEENMILKDVMNQSSDEKHSTIEVIVRHVTSSQVIVCLFF